MKGGGNFEKFNVLRNFLFYFEDITFFKKLTFVYYFSVIPAGYHKNLKKKKKTISVRSLHRIKSSVVSFTGTEFLLDTLPKSGLCKVEHDSAKSEPNSGKATYLPAYPHQST